MSSVFLVEFCFTPIQNLIHVYETSLKLDIALHYATRMSLLLSAGVTLGFPPDGNLIRQVPIDPTLTFRTVNSGVIVYKAKV